MKQSSLSEGWRLVKFGDFVENMNETTKDPASIGLDRVVGLDHMDSDSLPLKRWDNFGDLHEGTTFTRIFRAGQVLFGKRRAYQRKTSVPDFDGICSGDILVFQPKNKELLREFLPYLVQFDGFFDHAVGTSAGSLSPRTKWQELAKYEFVLPSVAEQLRIVNLMSAIDRALNLFRSISFDSLQAAIWADQSNSDETQKSTIGQECEILKGKKPAQITENSETGIGYLTADVLRGQPFTQFVEGDSLLSCNILQGTETLILWDGAGAGDVFHGQPGVVASTMAKVLPLKTSKILPEYLYFSLCSLSKEIKSTCRGSTVPHVAPASLRKLPLLIPSEKEQKRAVSVLSTIQLFSYAVKEYQKNLSQVRKSCLNKMIESKS